VAGLEWLSGDANLDGIVTGDDYTVIDANLGLGAGKSFNEQRAARGTGTGHGHSLHCAGCRQGEKNQKDALNHSRCRLTDR
jgi:hypothetical protein